GEPERIVSFVVSEPAHRSPPQRRYPSWLPVVAANEIHQVNRSLPGCCGKRSTPRSRGRNVSVWPPIRMDVDAPAIAPKRGQVIVRVGDIVAGAAIPDFEIDDIAFATVDETVPVCFSLGKPGGHPRPQYRLPGLGNQSRFAFEHHYELVFERV